MQVRYRVHSYAEEPVSVPAILASGQTAMAQVPGCVVELVEIDGSDTLTRRFVPADLDAARALFPGDGVVVATLSLEQPK